MKEVPGSNPIANLHLNHPALRDLLVDDVVDDGLHFRFARVDDPESRKVGAAVLQRKPRNIGEAA